MTHPSEDPAARLGSAHIGRARFELALFGLTLLASACTPVPPAAAPAPKASDSAAAPAAESPPRVQFARDIQPILDPGCRPCHFEGGKMYERLPFDRPETIRLLGEKLFTRIKEEKQRALIREFLAQEAAGTAKTDG